MTIARRVAVWWRERQVRRRMRRTLAEMKRLGELVRMSVRCKDCGVYRHMSFKSIDELPPRGSVRLCLACFERWYHSLGMRVAMISAGDLQHMRSVEAPKRDGRAVWWFK